MVELFCILSLLWEAADTGPHLAHHVVHRLVLLWEGEAAELVLLARVQRQVRLGLHRPRRDHVVALHGGEQLLRVVVLHVALLQSVQLFLEVLLVQGEVVELVLHLDPELSVFLHLGVQGGELFGMG